ncbi:MAG: hypothetical protein KDD38_07300 [Bdellovibrionales bacterium]|nr:hypothetical protein [Bdellovibrionales bacterium]
MLKIKNLLNVIYLVILASAVLVFSVTSIAVENIAGSEAGIPNLNAEATLDLIVEQELPNVRRGSLDAVEFGYLHRNLGQPQIVTPLQTTQYDFSTVSAPLFGYRLAISEQMKLSWSNRISYVDVEKQDEYAIATRLHVVPIQTEILWSPRSHTFSRIVLTPLAGIGIGGALQVQRGAMMDTSEFAELGSARFGLDMRLVSNSTWFLSADYQYQKSFSNTDDAWSGTGFDVSFGVGL